MRFKLTAKGARISTLNHQLNTMSSNSTTYMIIGGSIAGMVFLIMSTLISVVYIFYRTEMRKRMACCDLAREQFKHWLNNDQYLKRERLITKVNNNYHKFLSMHVSRESRNELIKMGFNLDYNDTKST